jgi:hypothetical protein
MIDGCLICYLLLGNNSSRSPHRRTSPITPAAFLQLHLPHLLPAKAPSTDLIDSVTLSSGDNIGCRRMD